MGDHRGETNTEVCLSRQYLVSSKYLYEPGHLLFTKLNFVGHEAKKD